MYKKKLQNEAASVLFISFLFTFTGHASSLLFTIGVISSFLTATFPAYFLFSVSHYMQIYRSLGCTSCLNQPSLNRLLFHRRHVDPVADICGHCHLFGCTRLRPTLQM